MKAIPNRVMLITYPDSLGGDLKQLRHVLDTIVAGAAGIAYDLVDPAFGDWKDVEALAEKYTLMCDMMVNHISRRSAEFEDYLRLGEKSRYAGMFFDYLAFFGGEPTEEELRQIYRRSDKPLFQEITLPDGKKQKLWCSFSAEQIDLDTNSRTAKDYIMRNLKALGSHGISVVRMDAYGYITKIRGTSCFFVEPQIWRLIEEMEELLQSQNMTLLPEVHDRYETALKIAGHGYWTYDFVMPLTVLHTLFTGSGKALKKWLGIAPRNQFTVLDTHDGIGVYDAAGIVTDEEADEVIRLAEPHLSYSYKPMDMSKAKYRKSYQLYGTYYSILNEDDEAYLLARAIQFFAPGIPQVYYVGMLAGRNDLDFDPKDPRNINRKNYSLEEIREEAERPVVQRLLAMMRLRSTHPAFDGELETADTPDHLLTLTRRNGPHWARLEADLREKTFVISCSGEA